MPDQTFSADLPELRLYAQLAGVAPSRMAAAFNDPEHFFDHITLEELENLKETSDRVAAFSLRLVGPCEIAERALGRVVDAHSR